MNISRGDFHDNIEEGLAMVLPMAQMLASARGFALPDDLITAFLEKVRSANSIELRFDGEPFGRLDIVDPPPPVAP